MDCVHYPPRNENCDNQGKEDEIPAKTRRPGTNTRTSILQLVADRTPRKFESFQCLHCLNCQRFDACIGQL